MLQILLLGIVIGGTEIKDRRIDLDAEVWIRAPLITFPDDRSYAVLFFSTNNTPKEREETERLIEKLNRLAKRKRKDYLVLLLSPDKEQAVRRFVKQHGIKLPVAAGSRAHKQFDIDDFPRLIVLERGQGNAARWDSMPAEALDALIPPPSADGIEPGGFHEASETSDLIRHAQEDPDDDERERALKILRGRLPTEEFLKLCDDLLAQADPATLSYGIIEYQRQLADPDVIIKRPRNALYTWAAQARRETPLDPRWARLNDYEKTISSKSVDQLWSDYQAFLTDEMSDVLVRGAIADALGQASDRSGARAALMRMLPMEPDDAVRLHIVGSIEEICEPGDTEAADFIEDQLAHEENVIYVRPQMRSTIRHLRTGE